jgi:Ca2+-binding EF-hand superfamily protein
MKKLTILAAFGAALSLGAAGSAFADHHGEKLNDAFKKADKDNDGTLDKEEAKALKGVSMHFAEIDFDKDGTVSMEEITAHLSSMKKQMHAKGEQNFKKADKDNDGTLDKEEAKALPRVSKNFAAIDVDKNGTVSMEEIHTFMKSKQGGKSGMHGHDDMHDGMHDDKDEKSK